MLKYIVKWKPAFKFQLLRPLTTSNIVTNDENLNKEESKQQQTTETVQKDKKKTETKAQGDLPNFWAWFREKDSTFYQSWIMCLTLMFSFYVYWRDQIKGRKVQFVRSTPKSTERRVQTQGG
jgi:hypothetical protein